MPVRRIAVSVVAAASVALTGLAVAPAAHANANGPGHYCAKYNGVAVREQPGGAARDNLNENSTFQVERLTNSLWCYGYKITNGVHGYVLRDSLDPC